MRALLAQNENLRLEVERLRKDDAPSESEQDDRSHGFTRDEWAAMAARCELRWDHPGMGNDDLPQKIDEEHAEELGLSAGQLDAANEVLRHHDRAAREEIRRIYLATTGDVEGGATLAVNSMIAEIHNKSAPGDDGLGRQRVAREMAGMLAPPPDAANRPAVEQLYRLLVQYGDRVERGMAERTGADLARRYRDSGRNRSRSHTNGCAE